MKRIRIILALVTAISMLFSITGTAATLKASGKVSYYKKASTAKSNKVAGTIKSGTKLNAISYSSGFVKFKSDKGTYYAKLAQVSFSGTANGTITKTGYSYKSNLKTKSKKFSKGVSVIISKLVKKGTKQYFVVDKSYYLDAINVKISTFAIQNPTVAPTASVTPTPTSTPTATQIVMPTMPIFTQGPLPEVQYIGRFETVDSDGKRFGFSGSTIRAKFTGTEVSAVFSSPSTTNWLEIVVDGVTLAPVNINYTTFQKNQYILASGLTNGEHVINVIKRTESFQGVLDFYGFKFKGGELLAPNPLASKRIEFIGDSITCGYGNEGTTPTATMTPARENFNKTYAALTAKQLNAEQQTVSLSGWGVTLKSEVLAGSSGGKLQTQYDRLYYQSTSRWDFQDDQPQVIVINLCTNDMRLSQNSYTVLPTKIQFQTGYNELLDLVKSKHPNSTIFCCVGPMLGDSGLSNSINYISDIVNTRKAAGDSKIYFFQFDQQNISLNGAGDDYHPSVKTHEIMANKLAPFIKSTMGW